MISQIVTQNGPSGGILSDSLINPVSPNHIGQAGGSASGETLNECGAELAREM
jgi:hypothetical protein